MQDLIGIIKQLKESTDETIEERTKVEALFTSIGDGAVVTDEHGKITRANKAAVEITGFNEKELIGKWFPKVIVAVDENGKPIDTMDRPIIRAFLSGKTVNEKGYILTKKKKQLPVNITVSPILLNDRPIGAVEVLRDISLEYEIDRMKSEFISIASHQLRTPLSAINTYANMLASGFQGELNDGQKEHLNIILSAVDRMNELITTLLDISQMEAGKINVSLQEIDLSQLLSNIMRDLQLAASAKDISVTTTLPKKKLKINSDPLLMGEIYSNFISNAIKYTPQGGKIDIAVVAKKKELVFCVHDTGLGIPKEMQNKVFTKFFRADNARKQDTSGTGLGLYLVKQISEILNGRVWFTSKEKKGSTFYFALPIDEYAAS